MHKKRDDSSSRFILCKIKHVQLCQILNMKYIHTFSLYFRLQLLLLLILRLISTSLVFFYESDLRYFRNEHPFHK